MNDIVLLWEGIRRCKENFFGMVFFLAALLTAEAQSLADSSSPTHLGFSYWSGYLHSKSNVDYETTKDGLITGGKVLLLWDSNRHRFDIGLGANLNTAKGETENRRQALTQISGLADFTYAYGVRENLDIGLVFHNEVGGGAHLDFSNLDRFQWWGGAGPTARLHFSWAGWKLMAGAAAVFDFSVPDRSQIKVPLSISVLFPVRKESKPILKQEPASAETTAPPPEEELPTAPALERGEIAKGFVAEMKSDTHVKIILPASRVSFDSGRAKVSEDGVRYLLRIGEVFGEFSKFIDEIDISGHTDKRGSAALNDRLSKERANGVLDALVSGGAPRDKLKARGAGSSEPREDGDSEDALAANRRVEVSIQVLSDAISLARKINQVDKEFE